jgi:signal transduction histidine kinase
MISLTQNRSIFAVMNGWLDSVREMPSPLNRLQGIMLSKGNNQSQQHNIKDSMAENEARASRAEELIAAWAQITKNEKVIDEYMSGLEKIMFVTQHKLRKPVTNMIGIAALLDKKDNDNSVEEVHQIALYLQKSAIDLDAFTRELTGMLSELSQKGKK